MVLTNIQGTIRTFVTQTLQSAGSAEGVLSSSMVAKERFSVFFATSTETTKKYARL